GLVPQLRATPFPHLLRPERTLPHHRGTVRAPRGILRRQKFSVASPAVLPAEPHAASDKPSRLSQRLSRRLSLPAGHRASECSPGLPLYPQKSPPQLSEYPLPT